MKKIEPKLAKGMRDLEPSDMVIRNRILSIIKTVFEKYGYEPLETPALEYWEILTGKYGDEAERLVYHLTDHGGRKLGLRYDLTVPLARYVASRKQLRKPFKRYQIQPVWRAEKPQKGRYREFLQCDVDAVGSTSMVVDAELIALTVEIMLEIGFKNFEVRLNNRKILQALVQAAGLDIVNTADVCLSLDKVGKVGWLNVENELAQKGYSPQHIVTLRQLLDYSGDSMTILEQLSQKLHRTTLGKTGITELKEILENLSMLEVDLKYVQVRPMLTRGLDYYTGPVYETFLTDIEFASLSGGGRYDGLVGIFSADQIPATGTSFGVDRIMAVLREIQGEYPVRTTTQIFVALFSQDLKEQSLALAARCRKAGFSTEVAYEPLKLKKQFSYAHQKGIRFVLLVGPEEVEAEMVQLKDMQRGEQEQIPLSQLENWITLKLNQSAL